MTSISNSWFAQRELSKLQAVPVVGPLFFSPVKAAVSIAEMAYGIAAAVLFGASALVVSVVSFPFDTQPSFLWMTTGSSFLHVGLGLSSLCYSVANFTTLGIVGFTIESVLYSVRNEEKHGKKRVL